MARTGKGKVISFYSFKGGAGRTMTLANMAWLLAESGRRVLAVDWDLEAPGLHRYFHPFLKDRRLRATTGVIDMIRGYASGVPSVGANDKGDWARRKSDVLSYAESLQWSFPGDGTLDFIPAGRQDAAYSDAMSTFNWTTFWHHLNGGEFLQALRDNMVENYDFVLIDSRTGMSDTTGICTVTLPDSLVACFTLNTQSIEGTAAVVHDVARQRIDRSIAIYPVPMRVEAGSDARLQAAHNFAAWRFGRVLPSWTRDEIQEYWQRVEIPHDPYFAYEEVLAPFAPESVRSGPVLAAAASLCETVTGTKIRDSRDFGRTHVERQSAYLRPALSGALVCYMRDDLVWARWLVDQLRDVGANVSAHALRAGDESSPGIVEDLCEVIATTGCNSVIVVETAGAAALLAAARDAAAACGIPEAVVIVRTGSAGTGPLLGPATCLELSTMTDEQIRAQLIPVAVPDVPHGAAGVREVGRPLRIRPRSDTDGSVVSNCVSRNQHFVGRQSLLEELHERLTDGSAARVQTLHGVSGAGKSAVALEYAHRFRSNYDMIWWISGRTPPVARATLGRLAAFLGAGVSSGSPDDVAALMRGLAGGTPYQHWLLIFDGVDDDVVVPRLELSDFGHVLVTSSRPAAPDRGLAVGPLTRDESIALLKKLVPGLSPQEYRRLAAELGDLPQALVDVASGLPVVEHRRDAREQR
ncbi:hypothetical protein Asp14428_34350 [Actinoplanes sp. NBRC 14428]|nr:hypothetical protein Asp14428_34350 [Actinoplanes sp. NBRC 14428]